MVKIRKNNINCEQPNKPKKKYYSFLTIALLICIFILLYSTVLNVGKILSYQGKIVELKKIQAETTDKNHSLKKQLNDLDSRSYEAIARNNLKMSGEDEVLIIIQEPEKQLLKTKKQKKDKKDKNKEKEKKDKN